MIRAGYKAWLLHLLKNGTPFLVSFFLLLIGLFPVRVSFLTQLHMPLVFISLFYWIIFRPDLLPPVVVFLLGVCSDLFYQNPLGLHAFSFLLFYLVVKSQRRFLTSRSFSFLWSAFVVFLIPLFIVEWLLASLLFMHFLGFWTMIGQAVLVIGVFPLVAGVCAWLYRRFLEVDE